VRIARWLVVPGVHASLRGIFARCHGARLSGDQGRNRTIKQSLKHGPAIDGMRFVQNWQYRQGQDVLREFCMLLWTQAQESAAKIGHVA
jgi:hypothetical protein